MLNYNATFNARHDYNLRYWVTILHSENISLHDF